MNTVINVERLHKKYGAVTAVADVTFAVHRGEVFGILGPNGAGKTTTVECLQGLRSRDGGRLEVLGLDPNRDAERLRRRTGSQLQSSALPDGLRVGEAITLFASRFSDTSAARMRLPPPNVGSNATASTTCGKCIGPPRKIGPMP